jgi:hypothetical protein
MEVGIDTAKLYPKNSGKVEIKCTKRGEHRTSRKHYVKVADDVKSIVKKDVHSCVSNAHPANTTGDKKENKRKSEKQW